MKINHTSHKYLIIIALILNLIYCSAEDEYNLIKVKISDKTIIEEVEKDSASLKIVKDIRSYGLKFVSNISTGFLWVITDDENLAFLKSEGYVSELVERGPELELHKRMVWGVEKVLPPGYKTYDKIVDKLKKINTENPDITSIEIIGKTQEFRNDVFALRLTENADKISNKPKILFSAAIHGNEIMGAEVVLGLFAEILQKHLSDNKFSKYISGLEIWFVPVINVDGYKIATTVHPSWRKNARDNDNNGKWSVSDGVDLNRNFDFSFDTGGSSDSGSKFYRGSYPFSENETKFMAEFIDKHKFLFSFTYHSAESRVYYPWRIPLNGSETYTTEDELLTEIAESIAGRIKCINEDFTYKAFRNIKKESYTTNYYYYKTGTIDFIIELGKYDHVYPKKVLSKIIEHNLPGAYYILDRAFGPGLTGVVTDSVSGEPASAEVLVYPFDNGDITLRRTNSLTGRFYRALKPGVYTIVFRAEGKLDKRYENVIINSDGWTELNVVLSNK